MLTSVLAESLPGISLGQDNCETKPNKIKQNKQTKGKPLCRCMALQCETSLENIGRDGGKIWEI